MAAVALEFLARADLQPVIVPRADAPSVGVKDRDRERDVRGHLDPYGAVRLDGRIAQHLAHAERRGNAEGAAAEIEYVTVGEAHRLLDAQESRGTLGGASAARVRHGGDAARRRVDAVDVVHAADVEEAHAFRLEIGIEVDAGHPVEQYWRERRGLQCDDVRVHDTLDGTCQRQLCARRRVVDPESIQWRGSHGARRGEPVGRAGDDSSSLQQSALRPAHQQPPRAIAQRKCRLEPTAW